MSDQPPKLFDRSVKRSQFDASALMAMKSDVSVRIQELGRDVGQKEAEELATRVVSDWQAEDPRFPRAAGFWNRGLQSSSAAEQSGLSASDLSPPFDGSAYDVLREVVAQDMVERLQDLNRKFPDVLEIGHGTGHCTRLLQARPGLQGGEAATGDAYPGEGVEHVVIAGMSPLMLRRDWDDVGTAAASSGHQGVGSGGPPVAVETRSDGVQIARVVCDEELPPFAPESLDLVLAPLTMHWTNDVEGAMTRLRQALRPDGAIIGAVLGGRTLRDLQEAMAEAELERQGGLHSHRFSPLMDPADVASLLTAAGYALPTVDTQLVRLELNDAAQAVDLLQGMGETAAPWRAAGDGAGVPGGAEDLEALAAGAAALQARQAAAADGSSGIMLEFEVIHFIGWAPDASRQQAPMRRGAAKHGFSQAAEGD